MRPIPPLDPANRFATAGAAPAQTRPVHTSRALPVQALTPEAFAPFGQVLTADGRRRLPINTYGDSLDLFREGFESDQPTEWFIFLGRDRGAGVLFLERHQQLTQTFIPVGGKGFHTVVAGPARGRRTACPRWTNSRPSGCPATLRSSCTARPGTRTRRPWRTARGCSSRAMPT